MMVNTEKNEGLIYLEDGSVFKGKGFGAKKTSVGRAGVQYIHDGISGDTNRSVI